MGEDATTWAQHLLDQGETEALLRADDLGLEQLEDLATVVLMTVANRRATWGRWNVHAETMRHLMGARFVTTADRTVVLDHIVARVEAESLRLTPAYDRAVPAHYVEGGGKRFQSIRIPEQAAEYRAAQVALARLRRLTKPATNVEQRGSASRVDRGRSLTQ